MVRKRWKWLCVGAASVAVVSLACFDMEKRARESAALQRIKVHTGFAFRQAEVPGFVPVALAKNWAKRMPVAALSCPGGTIFTFVPFRVGFDLRGKEVEDSDLIGIDSFTQLERLHLATRLLTDAGLENLRGLTRLRRLSLLTPAITDKSTALLAELPELESLEVYSEQVTDSGLTAVSNLSKLQRLVLYCPRVTDNGLRSLSDLANIKELDLSGCCLTDDGLVHLGQLRTLTVLKLKCTQVTDAGLKHLTGLHDLTELDLGQTQVTDTGLAKLKVLRNLRKLDVRRAPTDAYERTVRRYLPIGWERFLLPGRRAVSAQGVAALKRDLTDLQVER